MKTRLKYILLSLILMMTLSSCSSDDSSSTDEAPALTFMAAANNTGLYSITAVAGTENNDLLVKEVLLEDTAPVANLTLGKAYAFRSSSSSQLFFWAAKGTNTGTVTLCGLGAGASYQDAEGQELLSEFLVYFWGGLGQLSVDFLDISCLGPGESGYFIGPAPYAGNADYDFYDQLSKIVLTSYTSEAPISEGPLLSFSTPAYTTNISGYTGILNFNVTNSSTDSFWVDGIYLTLDDQDQPLECGRIADSLTGEGIIDPEQVIPYQSAMISAGTATQVWVHLSALPW